MIDRLGKFKAGGQQAFLAPIQFLNQQVNNLKIKIEKQQILCALVATKISQIFKLAQEKVDQLIAADIQSLQDG